MLERLFEINLNHWTLYRLKNLNVKRDESQSLMKFKYKNLIKRF